MVGLTNRDFSRLLVVLTLSALIWGLAGIGLVLLMQFISMQNLGIDPVDKHGPAEVQASRLGGLALILGGVIGLLIFSASGFNSGSEKGFFGIDWYNWIAVVGCAGLGFIEDISDTAIKPHLRLFVQLVIFSSVFFFWPFLIPKSINIFWIDYLLSIPIVAFGCCVIFSLGFLNAVNMTDGANGLISSICVVFFTIMFLEHGGLASLVMIYSSSVFLILNVISGRLFLGDAGAYAIGASLLIGALYFFSVDLVSLSFLAVLLFYPCFECLVTVSRRLIRGRPIMSADENHLHNRLHFHYRKLFRSKTLANSLVGLTIAVFTSGIALIGYLINPLLILSSDWTFVFICLLYTSDAADE